MYKKFSVSIPEETSEKLEQLGEKSGIKRSELVSKLIDFGLRNISNIADLEPLHVIVDCEENDKKCNIDLTSGEEITIKTKAGGFHISPFEEGDFVDIMPLRRNQSFERVSVYTTIPDKEWQRQGKYAGSSSLICIKLDTIPREEVATELLYDPSRYK